MRARWRHKDAKARLLRCDFIAWGKIWEWILMLSRVQTPDHRPRPLTRNARASVPCWGYADMIDRWVCPLIAGKDTERITYYS